MYKKIILLALLYVSPISGSITDIPSLEHLATVACIESLKTHQVIQAIGQAQIPEAVQTILAKNLCATYLLPLMEVTTYEPVTELHHPNKQVLSVAWNPIKNIIACGLNDPNITLWVKNKHNDSFSDVPLTGHKYWVTDIKWFAKRDRLLSNSGDYTIRVWDPNEQNSYDNTITIGPNFWPIPTLALNPDDQKLAVFSFDTIRILFMNGNNDQVVSSRNMSCMSWHPDATILAAGSQRGVSLFRSSQNSLIDTGTITSTSPIVSVTWDHDGSQLIFGSLAGGITVGYKNSENNTDTYFQLTGHTEKITAIAARPGHDQFVSALLDKTVKLWNTTDRTHITLKGHIDYVNSLSWKADGSQLATSSKDGNVKVWQMPQLSFGQLIAAFGVYQAKQKKEAAYTQAVLNLLSQVFVYNPEHALAKSMEKQLLAIKKNRSTMCSIQ